MTRSAVGPLVLSALFVTSCGGTAVLPTAPSLALVPAASAATVSPVATPPVTRPGPAPAAPAPRPGTSLPAGIAVSGIVTPVSDGNPPCWADRYACEAFTFTSSAEGTITVTLAWEGAPRALMVQLYWGDGLIAHEDISRSGTPRIAFTRPQMEAGLYRLRVVSLEPGSSIPFTLAVTY